MAEPPSDLSALLQFAKFSKGFRISDFEEFIIKDIGIENLDLFGRLAYPNQWQIRFTNEDSREEWIRRGSARIKNRSCWIYPLNKNEIRGFVHWLPNSVTDAQLKKFLKRYGYVFFARSEKQNIEGHKIQSDKRYFGLLLPREASKESLPHFLKINGFMCLLVVRGREPACFHCKEVGHRRVECPEYKAKWNKYSNIEPSNTAQERLRPRGRPHVKSKIEVGALTKDILETMQQIQQRTNKELRQNFKNFENEIAQTITRVVTAERDVGGILKETKPAATEIFENTFKKLGEFTLGLKALEEPLHDSATGESSEFTEEDSRESLGRLKKSKEDAIKVFQETSKGLEAQSSGGGIDTEAKLTEDIRSARQILAKTEEKATEICQKTIERLEVEVSKRFPTIPERAHDDKQPPKMASITTQPCVTLEPAVVSVFEIAGKDETEKATSQESEETIPGESDPMTVQGSFEGVEMGEGSGEQKIKTTEKASSEMGIFENAFKQLGKSILGLKAFEEPLHDSATGASSAFTEEDSRESLGILKEAKEDAMKHFQETSEGLEAHLKSQLSGGSSDTEAKSTEDIRSARQILVKTEKKATEIFQKTIERLEVEVSKRFPTIPERAHDDKQPPKMASITTQTCVTLEQVEQAVALAFEIAGKDDKDIVYETKKETSQQSESDPMTVQGSFEGVEMGEGSGEQQKIKTTEKASSEVEGMKFNVSENVRENIDKLQTNLKKIFASVQDKAELDPETIRILKQLESEVVEKVEETKTKWETDI